MTRITALSVVSEISPLVKTGGLADVAGALPLALKAEGIDTTTLVPGYPSVLSALSGAEVVQEIADLYGDAARLVAGKAAGLDLFVLDAPHLYARAGGIYTNATGVEYPDNALRFAALAMTASWLGEGWLESYWPDVLHAHDWQAALAPAYLHYNGRPRPATVLTIHNIAFQGNYDKGLLDQLGLPPRSFAMDGVEYYGGISFLKAGLQLADRITTVSPSYAVEIMSEEFGMGFDGLLRARADVVCGILNGVDEAVWTPAKDSRIPARYDHWSLAMRAKNKIALQRRLGLSEDKNVFLVGVVSRLTSQKGLDLLLESLSEFLAQEAQLALIGAGDKDLEELFVSASRAYPGKVGVHIGYDEDLSHLTQAGVDAFLVPSRFEPCGLTQLYALRYGATPIVARVGGLKDTVIDANEMALVAGCATGFQFSPVNVEALKGALRRARRLFEDKQQWRRMQVNGMKTDVSWRQPARRYAELYRSLLAARAA